MSRIAKNELLLGREVTIDETLAGIEAVTAEDVQRIAERVLGQPFALSAVGPVADLDLDKWVGEKALQ
jgi:predicted Zn-dependent peptidase